MEFWQRQITEFQDTENHCVLQRWANTAERYHSEAENARYYVEKARKQIGPPESRLKWVEQQLSALLAEYAVSTTQISTFDRLKDQAKLPKKASRSKQTTFKDLRSNRSNKSASWSNYGKKKKHASTNSALGLIHPSRVSKTAGIKTPRRRQQSKILAEHGGDQNQGLRTTISSVLPVNITPRRSSRLSNNESRSDTLKASLTMSLNKSV